MPFNLDIELAAYNLNEDEAVLRLSVAETNETIATVRFLPNFDGEVNSGTIRHVTVASPSLYERLGDTQTVCRTIGEAIYAEMNDGDETICDVFWHIEVIGGGEIA